MSTIQNVLKIGGSLGRVSYATIPPGLAVNLTYNGSANAPTNGGNYTVIGTINDPSYQGSATNTLVIGKASATIALGNLSQTYDGTAKSVSLTTAPTGLAVNVTYNGSANAPTNAGSYIGYRDDQRPELPRERDQHAGHRQSRRDGRTGQSEPDLRCHARRRVSTTTVPPGLAVNLTYNGSPSAPINAGSYTVVGTINDIELSRQRDQHAGHRQGQRHGDGEQHHPGLRPEQPADSGGQPPGSGAGTTSRRRIVAARQRTVRPDRIRSCRASMIRTAGWATTS